jgi:microcystin-dependent protein
MSSPYIGEIRMFGGNFAPEGWMLCSGQSMSIAEYDALFQVVGTAYGGDGSSTFLLPDLQCRVPIHQGNGFVIGTNGGTETVTLTALTLPAHTHVLNATTSPANDVNAANNLLAQASTFDDYQSTLPPTAPMAPQAVGTSGGNQPHDNLQPFLCVNFIISLYGVYPSPT